MNRNEHLIGGRWVASEHPAQRVENPATLETVGTAADADPSVVHAAAAAARAAQELWASTSPETRRDALLDLAEQIDRRSAELVDVLVAELGAPAQFAREVHLAATLGDLQGFASALEDLAFEERLGNSLVRRRPLGVVGCITPWNYPTHQIAAKVGAALAAGCAVVVKPAELTPLSAYVLGEAVQDSTLPPGLVNIVFGEGRSVGEALVRDADVDAISFTGSTGVGRHIAALAGGRLLPVALELGGKSASVVLDDADLERAVRWTVRSATVNSGQTCSACTRLVVPQHLAREAELLARDAMAELRVGDPREDVDLGPVVSGAQRDKIIGLLAEAEAAGATVHSRTVADRLSGHYVAPALVTGAERAAAIVQQEVFGPVLTLQTARDDDEAVEIANDSPYGLGGAVWSTDLSRARTVAARIKTGQVDLNGADWNLQAPFGGTKQSGFGRELGPHGILELTYLQSIQE